MFRKTELCSFFYHWLTCLDLASVLQEFVNGCRYMNATSQYTGSSLSSQSALISFGLMFSAGPTDPHNCPPLYPSMNIDIATNCRMQSPVVDEAVGQDFPIDLLPGCNSLWIGNTSKPDCPTGRSQDETLKLTSDVVYFDDEPYPASY